MPRTRTSYTLKKLRRELGLPMLGSSGVINKRQLKKMEQRITGSITVFLNDCNMPRSQVISLVQYAAEVIENEGFIKIWLMYRALPTKDREAVSYEALCDAAEIKWTTFLDILDQARAHKKKFIASQILTDASEEVLRKTVEFALEEKNVKDREMIHKMTGHLGADTAVNINNSTTNQTVNLLPGSQGIPKFDGEILENAKLIRTQEQLALPPAIDAETIEADVQPSDRRAETPAHSHQEA